MFQRIFAKLPCNKFHETSSNGYQVVTCGQENVHMEKLIDAFLQLSLRMRQNKWINVEKVG
jgi:hypothetical protein